MKKISHTFDKMQAMELVVLEDEHGRELRVQIPILRDKCPQCGTKFPGGVPDPDVIIAQVIAEHEQNEQAIRRHIEKRFHPETLEKL